MKPILSKYVWKKRISVWFIAALLILLLSAKGSVQHVVYGQPSNVPATFYGAVQPAASVPAFVPTAGMVVEAVINDQVCGQAETQQKSGEIIYVIKVLADNEVAGITGCGTTGKPITFFVDQTEMQPTTTWDNEQVWELDLSPTSSNSAPDAPVQLAPTGISTNASPTFEWQSVANATDYEIVVYNISTDTIDFTGTYSAAIVCVGASCVLTSANVSLLPGDYTWLIRALNGAVAGPWSVYTP